eukprot:CAMPEP_0174737668 /NCGR_PEP_ID=MMETSP1094-20130205/68685_1 /TAXON_ID=156173 /ORGANISM="Chrysochromulina brevifilum, Strain UTEX LB 985" /LENGTH=41 /DNA_ID= /DNA_START= /DNA_END= /DNA_ORIENTATION=
MVARDEESTTGELRVHRLDATALTHRCQPPAVAVGKQAACR